MHSLADPWLVKMNNTMKTNPKVGIRSPHTQLPGRNSTLEQASHTQKNRLVQKMEKMNNGALERMAAIV